MRRLFIVFILVVVSENTIDATVYEKHRAYEYLKERGEVYLSCYLNEKSQVDELTKIVSINNFNNITLEAKVYANAIEFERFLEYGLYYETLDPPGQLNGAPAMSDYKNPAQYESWNTYPTYDGYVGMMKKFANDYPDLCRIQEIGSTVKGRKLIFAIISDNVNTHEAEPRVMYTSTMHGNEYVGFVTMLRLIDYLLSKYETDSYIKNLVDNVEIWIMPNENPDGTYRSGDKTVKGAIRGNGNNIDLNRNYKSPHPQHGDHPDKQAWQPETKAFMALTDTTKFVMGMNFHTGAELLNYPFDSWVLKDVSHADDDWWQYVCRGYVDKVRGNSPDSYMSKFDGVTNGGDWYKAWGTRLDYINWYRYCREVTTELSNSQATPASNLPKFWDYNYESLLYYIEQSMCGINGIVINSITNKPIPDAKIFIEKHDRNNSHVFSNAPHGDFYRPITNGVYTIRVSEKEYYPKTITSIKVENNQATSLIIKLCPLVSKNKSLALNGLNKMSVYVSGKNIVIACGGILTDTKIAIYNLDGRLISKLHLNSRDRYKDRILWDCRDFRKNLVSNGCYILRIKTADSVITKSFVFSDW